MLLLVALHSGFCLSIHVNHYALALKTFYILAEARGCSVVICVLRAFYYLLSKSYQPLCSGFASIFNIDFEAC